MEPPAGAAPAELLYKRSSQAAARRQIGRHANASQSPVLPWARRAYETCLSAGSTAVTVARNWHFPLELLNGRRLSFVIGSKPIAHICAAPRASV